MKFSQKIGKTKIRELVQIDTIDEKLENRLWNTILNSFFDLIHHYGYDSNDSDKAQVCIALWKEFFGKRIDEIPSSSRDKHVSISGVLDYLKNWFFSCEWYEKYDLIEFISKIDSNNFNVGFIEECNDSLKIEMSAYRIVDNCIVQITSEEEIIEIEEALDNSSKWSSVNIHLKTSIEMFSNRENPDYRNSIKEAICSIESLCIIITGDKKATLGSALTKIESEFKIHGALKKAFSSLYGYTSDSGGIRHSLLEDDIEVSIEDAKFMIVSCSAFINYLKFKIEK